MAAVNVECCGLDLAITLERVTVGVDQDQIAGGDLGHEQTVRLHQEPVGMTRHGMGVVVVNAVVPSITMRETVGRREIDARLMFPLE